MTAPRLLPCGDCALSVDFGNVISAEINAQVHALDAALQAEALPGVIELVPTYRALMVHFDPLVVDFDVLRARILALAGKGVAVVEAPRRWRVPVAYGAEFGADLDDIAAYAGLSSAAFVEAHAAAVYRVMMIGFQPGFSYLGGLDPRLARPRREVPRALVPASSVCIGGAQTALGSVPTPSGWHLIGRAAVAPFLPGRDPPFQFSAGDEIVFAPVSATEWQDLSVRGGGVERLV